MPDIVIHVKSFGGGCKSCPMLVECSECESFDNWCAADHGRLVDGHHFEDIDVTPADRPEWCPIIAVLPEGHGRLIDADVIYKKCTDEKGCYFSQPAAFIGEAVDGAPTIVPAEKEEVHG